MHVEWIGIETVFVSHLESQDYVQTQGIII